MKNDLGSIISDARRSKKISQDKLAEKLHISRQSISNWENNYNFPDLETLKKICKILDLDFDNLEKYMPNYSNNRKRQKRNNVLIVILFIVIILLVIIWGFIKYRNNFEVYGITIQAEDIEISNGIFIKSNINYFFQLGNLNFVDSGKDIDNYRIKIYYKYDNEIRIIVDTQYHDNIILNEKYGYGEYFDNNFDLYNVYVDLISLENNSEVKTYKLQFNKYFESNKLFYFKSIGIDNKYTLKESDIISEDVLIDNNYVFESNEYVKKVGLDIFKYNVYTNVLVYSDGKKYLEYDLNLNNVHGNEFDYEKQMFIINFYYDINEDKLICVDGNCGRYKEFMKIIVNEANILLEN